MTLYTLDPIERAPLLARISKLELAHYSARYGVTDEARLLLRRPNVK